MITGARSGRVNLFVIGTPKTGTTSLYRYFAEHPAISVADRPQLHHFETDFNRHRRDVAGLVSADDRRYYSYDLADYHAHFTLDDDAPYHADLTPDYIFSESAADGIHAYNPDARILAILREPASFLRSMHRQLVNSGYEFEEDFLAALLLQKARQEESIKHSSDQPPLYFQYSDLIDYPRLLAPYQKRFRDHMRVIVYEDFRADNRRVLESIYHFLGVEPIMPGEVVMDNQTRRHRSGWMNRIRRGKAVRAVSGLLPRGMRRFARALNSRRAEAAASGPLPASVQERCRVAAEATDEFLSEHGLLLDSMPAVPLSARWGYR